MKKFSKVHHFLICLSSLSALVFLGCVSKPTVDIGSYTTSGSISIARLAPPVQSAGTQSVLGFLPFQTQESSLKLIVNRKEGTVSLMDGEKTSLVAQSEGELDLKAGTYTLMHKQRAPLWYAGDSYFTNREIPVPASGDSNRYLRGALGDFALFIDRDISIHSSEIWTSEVGGLRVPEEEIRKIYYSLNVGSQIEIR